MKSFQTRFKSLIQKVVQAPKYFLSSTQRNPFLILHRFYSKDNIFNQHLFLLNVKRKTLKELHIPKVTNTDMGFKLIGSCNGLLCLSHYSLNSTSTIFLWNPTTKQTKRIIEPESALMPHKLPPNCFIAFYFNHNEGDFQVVRLHSFEDTTRSDSVNKFYAVQVEKYSLVSESWRDVNIKCCDQHLNLKGCLFWTENSVTVKETLFWVAMELTEKVSNEMIISFNYCSNVINKIEMPFLVNKKDCVEVYKKLAVYKDSVALIICSETKNMEHVLDLWVFYDKYEGVECWSKVQTMGMFSRLEGPVGIWKNEILMATKKAIHSVSGIVAFLPEDDDIGAEFYYNVFNYEESYFPLLNVEELGDIESEGFLLL